MKTVEVHLGYFKQGDDLYSCVEEMGNNIGALCRLYERLEAVIKHIGMICWVCTDCGSGVEIEADTHFIALTVEDKVAQRLVDEGYAHFPEYEDEEE